MSVLQHGALLRQAEQYTHTSKHTQDTHLIQPQPCSDFHNIKNSQVETFADNKDVLKQMQMRIFKTLLYEKEKMFCGKLLFKVQSHTGITVYLWSWQKSGGRSSMGICISIVYKNFGGVLFGSAISSVEIAEAVSSELGKDRSHRLHSHIRLVRRVNLRTPPILTETKHCSEMLLLIP